MELHNQHKAGKGGASAEDKLNNRAFKLNMRLLRYKVLVK